jgi:hypothetical protein
MRPIATFGLVATVVFLASSCTTSINNEPIITSLEADAQGVVPLSSVRVVCIASDPDGDGLSYYWLASAGEIEGVGSTATWIAPAFEGSYSVAVDVTDGRGGQVMRHVTIAVRANNQPKIAGLTADTEWIIPSGTVQVRCTASDSDGDELDYDWSASGGELRGEGDVVTWTAPASEGSYNIAVVVTDGRGGEVTGFMTVIVRVNRPPAIASLTANAGWILPSGTLQVTCTASDADGDELLYDWSTSGGEIDGEGYTITWEAPASEGSYSVAVTVTDGRGGEAMDYVTITVRANNNPPTIASLTADPGWTSPSGNLQVTCSASDPDNDELSYSWTATGGSISGTGAAVDWTAPQQVGTYNITVLVTDGYGGSATETRSVSVLTGQSPIIETLLITADHCYLKPYSGGCYVGKGQMYDIECIVSDTNVDLSYEWSYTGGEISGEGPLITWTAPDTSGYVTVTVTASDIADNTATEDVTLNVVPCSYCMFGC